MRIFLVIVLSFALLSHLLGAPGKHFLIETDGDVTEHNASNNNPIKTYTTNKDAIGDDATNNDATDNKPEGRDGVNVQGKKDDEELKDYKNFVVVTDKPSPTECGNCD